jgi:hypothetical protein
VLTSDLTCLMHANQGKKELVATSVSSSRPVGGLIFFFHAPSPSHTCMHIARGTIDVATSRHSYSLKSCSGGSIPEMNERQSTDSTAEDNHVAQNSRPLGSRQKNTKDETPLELCCAWFIEHQIGTFGLHSLHGSKNLIEHV